MTDQQDQPEPSRFEHWVEAAQAKRELWRTLLGGLIIVAVWAMWTFAVLFTALLAGLLTPENLESLLGRGDATLDPVDNIILTCLLLSTFLGIWLGVFIAVRVLHSRRFKSVLSWEGKLRWSQFAWGFLIGAVYLGLGLATSFLSGSPPERSAVELDTWLVGFAPIVFFLVFQTAGEELFFRGYLVQQFAARFHSPLVWGLAPAILFGLGHYGNVQDSLYAAYYVVATVLFAIIATVIVWRTGSIAATIGLHLANNIGAFTLAGPADSGPGIQLWVWPEPDVIAGAPLDLLTLVLMLAFVLSPWAPFSKGQAFARKKEMRAAP